MKLSKAELSRAADRAESLRSRLANFRKKTEKVTEKVVHTMEVGAAAFASGVIQGKTGGIEIVGVPLDLGLGLALNVMGYLGLGGKMSDHLNGLGDGFLAGYLTTLGRGVGVRWNMPAAASKGTLSDAEAAALARRAAGA